MTPYTRCPKCGCASLPSNQALPAACPQCGVILAKVGQTLRRRPPTAAASSDNAFNWSAWLMRGPDQLTASAFGARLALLLGLSVWGWQLVRLDYRSGEMMMSFLHRPLLIFHEAGHVLFMPFGQWLMVLGGTLGQLLMPVIMSGALLVQNRDPFGAAVGLWLLGVSLLDVAPYMYDALEPQLMLLSGSTGEAGGHDWIYLFKSMGLLSKAQSIGGFTHTLGALVLLLALGWAAWLLKRQYQRLQANGF